MHTQNKMKLKYIFTMTIKFGKANSYFVLIHRSRSNYVCASIFCKKFHTTGSEPCLSFFQSEQKKIRVDYVECSLR